MLGGPYGDENAKAFIEIDDLDDQNLDALTRMSIDKAETYSKEGLIDNPSVNI